MPILTFCIPAENPSAQTPKNRYTKTKNALVVGATRGPTITIPGVVRLADFADPDGNRIRLAQDVID